MWRSSIRDVDEAASELLRAGDLDDLIAPNITLHVTEDAESQRAFDLLNASDQFFLVEMSDSSERPYATWADTPFVGVEGVDALLRTFAEMNASVDKTLACHSALYTEGDPALERAMRMALAQNHREAQVMMRRS